MSCLIAKWRLSEEVVKESGSRRDLSGRPILYTRIHLMVDLNSRCCYRPNSHPRIGFREQTSPMICMLSWKVYRSPPQPRRSSVHSPFRPSPRAKQPRQQDHLVYPRDHRLRPAAHRQRRPPLLEWRSLDRKAHTSHMRQAMMNRKPYILVNHCSRRRKTAGSLVPTKPTGLS